MGNVSSTPTNLKENEKTDIENTTGFILISAEHENDVLLGRGTPINTHRGNINFRNIIKEYKENYFSARNNYEKYLITVCVHQRMKNQYPPGRFMRYDSKNKSWFEATDEDAKNKISQALREKEKVRKTTSKKKSKKNAKANTKNGSTSYEATSDTNKKNTKTRPSILRLRNTSHEQKQHLLSQSCHQGLSADESTKSVACEEDNKDKFMGNLPSETVADIDKPDEVMHSNTTSNCNLSPNDYLRLVACRPLSLNSYNSLMRNSQRS